MTTMNVSLPDALKAFVDDQIAKGGYSSASEYVRELIRRAQKQAAQERLEVTPRVLFQKLKVGPPRDFLRRPGTVVSGRQRKPRRIGHAYRAWWLGLLFPASNLSLCAAFAVVFLSPHVCDDVHLVRALRQIRSLHGPRRDEPTAFRH